MHILFYKKVVIENGHKNGEKASLKLIGSKIIMAMMALLFND